MLDKIKHRYETHAAERSIRAISSLYYLEDVGFLLDLITDLIAERDRQNDFIDKRTGVESYEQKLSRWKEGWRRELEDDLAHGK